MAAGNKHLGYKAALNAIEARVARHEGRVLPQLPRRMAPLLADHAATERAGLGAARSCGAPTTGEVCAFCRLVEQTAGHEPVPVELVGRRGGADDDRVRLGDKVLLLDTKQRRYLVTLNEGGEFHTHTGFFAHAELVGQPEGIVVKAPTGRAVHRAAPDARGLRGRDAPRRAGDLPEGPRRRSCMLADIAPGCGCSRAAWVRARCRWRCCAGRRRSSATSCARTSPTGPAATCAAFLGEEVLERYRVELRDCYDGIDERDLDRVVLDLPEPWRSCPTPSRRCARRDPGGLHARRSSRPRSCARRLASGAFGGTDPGGAPPHVAHRGRRRCGRTTAWWRTPGSSPPPASAPERARPGAVDGALGAIANELGWWSGRRAPWSGLDEDALPGALLGRLDDGVELPVGDVGHAGGALGVALRLGEDLRPSFT